MSNYNEIFNQTATFIDEISIPEYLFQGKNADNNIFQYIKSLYVGKCKENKYIKDVLKINHSTNPRLEYNQQCLSYKKTIVFEAAVNIFLPGDYILAKMIDTNIAKVDNVLTITNIKPNKDFKGITSGDKLPMVLNEISYNVYIKASAEFMTTIYLFTTAYVVTDASLTLSLIPLTKSGEEFYDTIYNISIKSINMKSSKSVGKSVTIDKINVGDKVLIYKDKYFIGDENNLLIKHSLNDIIRLHNKFIMFVNSFELDKKIKLIYDNI